MLHLDLIITIASYLEFADDVVRVTPELRNLSLEMLQRMEIRTVPMISDDDCITRDPDLLGYPSKNVYSIVYKHPSPGIIAEWILTRPYKSVNYDMIIAALSERPQWISDDRCVAIKYVHHVHYIVRKATWKRIEGYNAVIYKKMSNAIFLMKRRGSLCKTHLEIFRLGVAYDIYAPNVYWFCISNGGDADELLNEAEKICKSTDVHTMRSWIGL